MSEIKIQPWRDDIEDDGNYMKKLNTLSNFSSAAKSKKDIIKKKCIQQEILKKLSKNSNQIAIASAQTTLQNFNKTNRSEYRHRITRLVFSQQNNKKYKFEPQVSPIKKRLGLITSHKFFKKSPENIGNKNYEDQHKKSHKQIYYNLTEVNSPVNSSIKLKCLTEQVQQDKIQKIRMFSKVREDKKIVNPPVFRQLSVERKIYILQSGGKTNKFSDKEITPFKRGHRKRKNIIDEICKAEKDYSRQIKKDF